MNQPRRLLNVSSAQLPSVRSSMSPTSQTSKADCGPAQCAAEPAELMTTTGTNDGARFRPRDFTVRRVVPRRGTRSKRSESALSGSPRAAPPPPTHRAPAPDPHPSATYQGTTAPHWRALDSPNSSDSESRPRRRRRGRACFISATIGAASGDCVEVRKCKRGGAGDETGGADRCDSVADDARMRCFDRVSFEAK